MSAAETTVVVVELLIVAALVPVIAFAWRHEIKRRRFARLLTELAPAIVKFQVAMAGLAAVSNTVIPALERLSEALRAVGDRGDSE